MGRRSPSAVDQDALRDECACLSRATRVAESSKEGRNCQHITLYIHAQHCPESMIAPRFDVEHLLQKQPACSPVETFPFHSRSDQGGVKNEAQPGSGSWQAIARQSAPVDCHGYGVRAICSDNICPSPG